MSNSYLVKELDIHDIDNKIIKDTLKDAFSFTDFSEYLLRE
jgi:hypothetical protein